MKNLFLVLMLGTMLVYGEGEFLLDTNLVYGPLNGGQRLPSVAFDGTNYLVVWEGGGILCARINQSGEALDTTGIRLSYTGQNPSVAFDGINYFVVWPDGKNIYGARVDQSGIPLDTVSQLIHQSSATLKNPSIVFGNTNYLVAWEKESYYQVCYARVNQAGVVIDTSGILIPKNARFPALAFDGINYLITYSSGYNIYGSRIDQTATVLDTFRISQSFSVYETISSVVFGGSNYFVAFHNSQGLKNIYGARVTTSGTVLDTTNILICSAFYNNLNPSVAFDGSNYLIVWTAIPTVGYYDSATVYGARVSQDGLLLDPSGIRISELPKAWYPAIIFGNIHFLVTWEQNGDDIYGARLDQSGNVLDSNDLLFTIGTYGQYSSSGAFDGTNYFVVWCDERNVLNNSTDIYGTRLSTDGVILDPEGISISTAGSYQQVPSVAYGADQYFVAWQDSRLSGSSYWETDIYGTRVNQSGLVLDPDGIPIALGGLYESLGNPAVASNDTNYLVVWENENPYKLRGAVVDADGNITASFDICSGTGGSPSVPSVVFGDNHYFVVWYECRHIGYVDIYGARIARDGTLLDPDTGFGITTTAVDPENYYPSVGFDGTDYFVVWARKCAGSDNYDIYGARVAQSGQVLDPYGIAICGLNGEQTFPAIIFNDRNYIVAWTDMRDGFTDINGAVVDPSGNVIDTFSVSTQFGNQNYSNLVKGLNTRLLITYTGWTPEINGRPANTYRIWGKFHPFTGIEEAQISNLKSPIPNLLIYPNPFSNKLDIRYQIPDNQLSVISHQSSVSLQIYDATGRLVRSFPISQLTNSSINQVTWSGDDDIGRKLPAGIYFCQLQCGEKTEVKKLIMVR